MALDGSPTLKTFTQLVIIIIIFTIITILMMMLKISVVRRRPSRPSDVRQLCIIHWTGHDMMMMTMMVMTTMMIPIMIMTITR